MSNNLLKIGDRNDDVERLQTLLIEKGILNGSADGVFGPNTENAVMKFQRKNDQVVDGIVGENTWNRLLGSNENDKRLKEEDLRDAAIQLGCELAAIKAISEVESNGGGFLDDGRPKILFERHIMIRRLLNDDLTTLVDLASQYRPDIVNAHTGGYKGGKAEWSRFLDAYGLNHESAIESCSWGRYQIMGMHWKYLGYSSQEEFKDDMCKDEGEHLFAFTMFIENDSRLHTALKEKDWTTFARIYNGPAYAKNRYDEKMKTAYEKHLNT